MPKFSVREGLENPESHLPVECSNLEVQQRFQNLLNADFG